MKKKMYALRVGSVCVLFKEYSLNFLVFILAIAQAAAENSKHKICSRYAYNTKKFYRVC